MAAHYYTNGIDVISVIHKEKSGYRVRDRNKNTLLLPSLKGYRRLDDNKSIKEWYQDYKKYLKQHPVSALLASLAVFFGMTDF